MGAIIGIISGLYLRISIAFFIVFVIGMFIRNTNFKRYIKVFINKKMLLIVGITAVIFFIYLNIQEILYKNIYRIPKKITLEGKIISNCEDTEYYNKYIFLNNHKRFILLTSKSKNLEYGDSIKLNAEYMVPDEARNYKGFNYKQYLKTQKIYGTLKAEKIEVVNKNTCNIIFKLSNKLQTKIIKNAREILPEDTRELFLGILLGEKGNISEQITESFKSSSLSHILAVSGMHVSYIILGITYIAINIKIHKKVGYIVTILTLIMFMFITNFSASVVRACIMGILLVFSKICYRKSDIWTTISISMLIMLIYNPYSILNVGLQLSYAGTIGIIVFNKNITSFFEKYMDKKLATSISVIISAQIAILPIMLINFNSLSLTFLLSNILATPIVAVITIGGFLLIFVSFISIEIAVFFSVIIHIFLKLLILISDISSVLLFSQIFVITPNILQVIYYYFLVFLLNFFTKNRSQRRLEKRILKLFYKRKIIIMLVVILIMLSILNNIRFSKFTINFIDVGQRRQHANNKWKR